KTAPAWGSCNQANLFFSLSILGIPGLVLTFVALSFSDTNHINHFILPEHSCDCNLLLQFLTGPVDLLSYCTSVHLNFHEVRFLLAQGKQAHLEQAQVLFHAGKVLLQLLLALVILPFLAVLCECLLLGFPLPVLVKAPLAFITDVLSKDGLQTAQTTGSLDVANNTNYYHGRCFNHSNCFHNFFLIHLWERKIHQPVHLPDNVGHASLVAQEGSQVNGLALVILREALHFATMSLGTLAGQEAQGTMSGG
uniref:Uncharacterized protein n=1 Tax=Xenopus tropicalis TaxID=8364 RepID=A0A6I8S1B3_XENTR